VVDIPGNSTTTSVVSVGSTTNGSVEVGGDHDWFKISLTAGQIIQVTMNGLGLSALEDPYLRIRDSSGAVIFENDDHGGSRNAFVAFQASYSGVYYIDAAAWDNDPPEYNYTGDYELKVEPWQEPPVATIDQIANQLTHGYWDGDSHHFAVTQGGTISVNLIELTSAGQSLAREALRQWSDIIGVSFTEVGIGGQITFDDNEDGASTGPVWADGIMSSAHVNIAASWLRDYGTTVGTYSFQTYVHEIGHALGLGHAGNYNGDATFPYDARFLNDATPMSVMSYFSPVENTYFSGLNFSDTDACRHCRHVPAVRPFDYHASRQHDLWLQFDSREQHLQRQSLPCDRLYRVRQRRHRHAGLFGFFAVPVDRSYIRRLFEHGWPHRQCHHRHRHADRERNWWQRR
jgi:hypothetical protein